MFESHHRAIASASAFRKDNENRFFFSEFPPQIGQRVGPAIFSPHWQSIEHDCRKNAGRFGLKKNIAGGDGKSAFTMSWRKCCAESERIEMAAMICRKDKWPMRRQILAACNRKAMGDGEVTPQQAKTEMMRNIFEQTALAADAAKTFGRRQAGVARGLELPRFHCSGSAKNSFLLGGCESDKIIDVMKDCRRDKDEAVEPIEKTAMAGDYFGGVLQTEIAFD